MDPKTEPRAPAAGLRFAAALAVLALPFATAAEKREPPPHASVGQKFVPADVAWDRPVYQTNFDDPSELRNWKLEGGKRVVIENGKLVLESEPGKRENHLVCWLTTEMPAEFLLEFAVRPQDRSEGLNIVFFSTRGAHGESIFDPGLRLREGVFKQYHSSDINGYHISYWAGGRGTANVRKNAGFHLVATGPDRIREAPKDSFQVVRVYQGGPAQGLARVYEQQAVSRAAIGGVHDSDQYHHAAGTQRGAPAAASRRRAGENGGSRVTFRSTGIAVRA